MRVLRQIEDMVMSPSSIVDGLRVGMRTAAWGPCVSRGR